mmetsp:Transcript_21544/g.71240  ORF Transcript_21544/g.71240 Transcript_21544/m.71240 type:complete len:174 (+) Transcript_21544:284-805(+)
MRPGELVGGNGARANSGESPSGAARGDRFIFSHELDAVPLPAVHAVVTAVGLVAGALAAPLAARAKLRLLQRTQSLFACFPGGGARYGPHFDGGGTDGRRMTAIAYANCGWRPEHGGALELLEEEAEGGECWRAIPPAADTLLLFRSDRMLHKVAPSHSTRFALTTFFYAHVL